MKINQADNSYHVVEIHVNCIKGIPIKLIQQLQEVTGCPNSEDHEHERKEWGTSCHTFNASGRNLSLEFSNDFLEKCLISLEDHVLSDSQFKFLEHAKLQSLFKQARAFFSLPAGETKLIHYSVASLEEVCTYKTLQFFSELSKTEQQGRVGGLKLPKSLKSDILAII